jgi:hypothetical protein
MARLRRALPHAGKTAQFTIETCQITVDHSIALPAPRTNSRDARHKASNYPAGRLRPADRPTYGDR